jgi:NAD-dependent deacetylase
MKQTQQLAEIIESGNGAVVFFGGAGVSTESGIPDFRSENGLYSAQHSYGFPPETLLSHTMFVENPALFFRYYKENLISRDAKPNAAHFALAQMEKRGLLRAVITQNTDGLHYVAGSENVFELHGSKRFPYCVSCFEKYDLDYIFDIANCKEGVIPVCQKCGGIVRPDVVLYEESLDSKVIQGATAAISEAQVLIVGGTSLAVYPAAGLLYYFSGGPLVLINKSETSADKTASLIIRDSIGEVLGETMRLIEGG